MAATMGYPMGNPAKTDFSNSRAKIMGAKLDIWLDGPGSIEPSYTDFDWWKPWCDVWNVSLDPYGTLFVC